MFLLCLWASRPNRGTAPRIFILVVIGATVRCAEWLNRFGAENWEKFASQDYFDNRGIFVSSMLSGPLLLDCLLMLMLFVREASQLLVQVKRNELASKRTSKNAKNQEKRRGQKED